VPTTNIPAYQAVAQSRLYEQIVEQIERSILDGQLKPGDQLPPERELADRFGVSRTAVREAMKALREKGLVESQHGRGTFVTDSTSRVIRHSLDRMMTMKLNQPEVAAHLIEVRELLEPEIAARAASRADERDVAAMRDAYAAMERAGADAEAFIEADLDFHLALAEAARNPLILALIDSIVALLREHRLRIFFVHGGPQRGQFHHRNILDAVARHDPDAARQAMNAHLSQVTEDARHTAPPLGTP
jgi:GntR family transcriptional regulator, transcriptional repressor for pyruvate dehydrogenase complex